MSPSEERVLLAVVSAIPPTLTALGAFLAALRAFRQAREVAERMDGRLDQLVQAEVARARLTATMEAQHRAAQQLPHPQPPAVG